MIKIRKTVNFENEERAIRNQVYQGLRCSGCLKPLTNGEGQPSSPKAKGGATCPQCSSAPCFPETPPASLATAMGEGHPPAEKGARP